MICRLALAVGFCLFAAGASAQSQTQSSGTISGSTVSMKKLIDDGYEIKAAVPNGSKFVVFMQKDQSAYACEFVSLTNTRCGAIN